jgi:hypothetical protein
MKRLILLCLPILTLLLGFQNPLVAGQPPSKTQILVVGTHYLPSDIMHQTRQQEIQSLVSGLSQFHPNKVLLEIPSHSAQESLLNQNYEAYLNGLRPMSRTVEEQFGFRLAAVLGLEHLYGLLPGDPVFLSGLVCESDEGLQFTQQARMIETAKLMHIEDESILSYISYLNRPYNLENEHSTYVKGLSRLGAGTDYEGADLLGQWYAHHLKLFANLTRIANAPGERVVVFIDSRNIPILKDLIEADPQYEWVPLEDYLQVK